LAFDAADFGLRGSSWSTSRLRVQAAVPRTQIVARAVGSNVRSFRLRCHSLFQEIHNHFHEGWMSAYRRSSNEMNPFFFAQVSSLVVQIEKDFHVIGDEANRDDNHVLQIFFGVQLFDTVTNIGLQPWLLWWS
jgi:hypothetical protein